mgnify:CR=1 FL=1
MSTALTTPDEVVKRLGDLDLADGELGMIESFIEDCSDAARDYGNPMWTSLNVPLSISRLVASAVADRMRNPDRFNTSRASDEMMGWQDSREYDWFTEPQIARLGRAAKPTLSTFGSIQVVAYQSKPRRSEIGYVPWGTDARPFPLEAEVGGW